MFPINHTNSLYLYEDEYDYYIIDKINNVEYSICDIEKFKEEMIKLLEDI